MPQAATTEFVSGSTSFTLQRFPPRRHDPLQAWDSADEVLLSTLPATLPKPILILNDSFGALALARSHESGFSQSDSFVALAALAHNQQLNQLEPNWQALPMSAPTPSVSSVLLKLPKSQSLLHEQLQRLSQLAQTQPIRVYGAAKSKQLTPSIRALLSEYLEAPEFSPIVRKCRHFNAVVRAQTTAQPPALSVWAVPEFDLQLSHEPGVFARNQLDLGARVLLAHLPPPGAQQVIDLGAGNGVIGLAYARRSPDSSVTWVDESYLASASCAKNITDNLPGAEPQYSCRVDDCLSSFAAASADLILCNPPFHQEFAITDHIALQMFKDAKRVLVQGGELRVVGNRHLNYHHHLKRLFGHCEILSKDAKFVVISVRKR